MPDQLIDGWLVPHVRRTGWPPTKEWQIVFGLSPDYTLDRLKSLRWSLQPLALDPRTLAPTHLSIVFELFETYVGGKFTKFSTMSGGLARFQRCCGFLKQHGVFPWPIVMERERDGLRVLDGHHRLTAFFFLYGHFRVEHPDVPCLNVHAEQNVWLAVP